MQINALSVPLYSREYIIFGDRTVRLGWRHHDKREEEWRESRYDPEKNIWVKNRPLRPSGALRLLFHFGLPATHPLALDVHLYAPFELCRLRRELEEARGYRRLYPQGLSGTEFVFAVHVR